MRIGRFNSILPRINDKPWSLCQLLPTSQKITDDLCKKWGCDTPLYFGMSLILISTYNCKEYWEYLKFVNRAGKTWNWKWEKSPSRGVLAAKIGPGKLKVWGPFRWFLIKYGYVVVKFFLAKGPSSSMFRGAHREIYWCPGAPDNLRVTPPTAVGQHAPIFKVAMVFILWLKVYRSQRNKNIRR